MILPLPDGRYAVILPAGGRIVVRTRAEAEECAKAAKECVCHSGSVCGPACAEGRHHEGCGPLPEKGKR